MTRRRAAGCSATGAVAGSATLAAEASGSTGTAGGVAGGLAFSGSRTRNWRGLYYEAVSKRVAFTLLVVVGTLSVNLGHTPGIYLTWNKEKGLVCPANLIGPVDLFLVSHHGSNQSDSPQLIHALHPKVALMNNGPKKGASPEIWQTLHDSPGLQDFWQLHFAVANGKEHNTADSFIAHRDSPGRAETSSA